MPEVATKMWLAGCLICCSLPLVYTADMPIQVDIRNLNLELVVAGCDHFLYELKTCSEHRLYLYDARGGAIAHLLLGGWGNNKCHMKIISTGRQLITDTPSVFSCNKFRWFWVSWNNSLIEYGRGQLPGESVLISLEDASGRRVRRLQLRTTNSASTAKIGHFVTGSVRYEKDLSERLVTTNRLQSISSTSLKTCATECSGHAECGLFSYNPAQRTCHLIDRRAQVQHYTTEKGWATWRMLFC